MFCLSSDSIGGGACTENGLHRARHEYDSSKRCFDGGSIGFFSSAASGFDILVSRCLCFRIREHDKKIYEDVIRQHSAQDVYLNRKVTVRMAENMSDPLRQLKIKDILSDCKTH